MSNLLQNINKLLSNFTFNDLFGLITFHKNDGAKANKFKSKCDFKWTKNKVKFLINFSNFID